MRIGIWIGLCLLAWVSAASAFEPPKEGYELHEWGVFSVPRNDAWAQRDMRAEWAGFPKFFDRVWPDKHLPWNGPVKKPVIFLYTAKEMSLEMNVRFAEGRPLVWWPHATSPADYGGGDRLGGDLKTLQFTFNLKPAGLAGDKHPPPPDVPAGHWVETLRKVEADLVFTGGGFSRRGDETPGVERFIYYDGVMKAPPAPEAARDGDNLALKTTCDHAMLDVLVIDRRGGKVFVSKPFIEKVDAGPQSVKIELVAADDKALEALQKELAARLEKAGLTAAEAGALVKIWKPGFFDADGLTLLYRVPQEIYEKWLPLTAKPAPNKTVRVGLVVHEHLEPELETTVNALIAKLSAEDFDTRDTAQKALLKIGGAAFPILTKHFSDTDAETAKACKLIVEALDVTPALKDLEKKDK